MIVRDRLPFNRVWPHVSKRLALLFLFDLSIAGLYSSGCTWLALSSLPMGTMGAALSLFLAFRNNSAYGRWWEARILWGALVNWSRSIARQALTFLSSDDEDTRERQTLLVHYMIAFVCALRCHLRGQSPLAELCGILGAARTKELRRHDNIPSAIVLEMGNLARSAYQNGWMDSYRFVRFEESLTELTNIMGGCERIKNTPLPRQYEYFPRLLVSFFCLMLPFGLVEGMGMLTPLASTAISFIFISLDSVGRELEDPFENTVHDTPMTGLSRTIEINLRQQLEEHTRLEKVTPVHGFVY